MAGRAAAALRRAAAGLRRAAADPRGAVVVWVSTASACLVLASALVLDVGLLYAARARLQAVADAAALAGAQALPSVARARELAEEYLERNGVPIQEAQVEADADRRAVRVQVREVASTALAAVAGLSRVRLGAEAEAQQVPAGAVRGAVPLGVAWQGFQWGQPYRLKLGPCGASCPGGERPTRGNFHALALGGRGADTYRENLNRGYPGWLQVGERVETEPGNMSGPTRQGLQARLEADPYSTWDRPRAGSPRVLVVPVVDGFGGASGRDTVQVLGFAAFFLEAVDGGEVVGRFLRWRVPGRAASGAQGDYGVYVLRLVR